MDLESVHDYLSSKDIHGRAITSFLDSQATCLTQDSAVQSGTLTALEYREHVGQTVGIWPLISLLWEKLSVQAMASVHDGFTLDDDEELVAVTSSLARFLRNLVAGVPVNQEQAFLIILGLSKCLPFIRKVLYEFTSYRRSASSESKYTTRMLVQMVSNILTSNDTLSSSFWNSEMEGNEQDSMLLRMLTFADESTQLSTAILVLNCTKGSYRRSHQLSSTLVGTRVIITLLDKLESSLDREEAPQHVGFSEISHECIQSLIEQSLAGALWESLVIKDEPITPHQTILLKIFDAHLHSQHITHSREFMFILPVVSVLVERARASVQRALGMNNSDAESSPNKPLLSDAPDVKLAPLLNALILAAGCSFQLTLNEIDDGKHALPTTYSRRLKDEPSLIEDIVDLLRLLDRLLPRILWGKISPSPHQQHEPNAEGPAVVMYDEGESGTLGFAYVKRELVKLIGVVAHSDLEVQHRLRACGGIEVVLNMCIVDERNPFMREHALFALKHILADNEENQAFVAALKPIGTWDSEGILRDSKGGVRR